MSNSINPLKAPASVPTLAGIPDWNELSERVEDGDKLSPLEQFIYDYEAGPGEGEWRKALVEMVQHYAVASEVKATEQIETVAVEEMFAVIVSYGHGVVLRHEKDARWAATGIGTGADGFGVPTIADCFRQYYDDEPIRLVKIRVVEEVKT